MNDGIRISIIIPSYNQGAFIENAILSIRKQDYPEWELIIQDGGSQDQTREVCERYVQMDDRIKFFSEPDRGFADAVNKALLKCSGALAGIQSSDDFYAHNRVFSQLVETWNNHQGLSLISGHYIAVDAELRELPIPQAVQEDGFLLPETIFVCGNYLEQGSTFFSVKRAIEIGGLDPELDMCADADFFIKMAVCKPVSINAVYRVPFIWGAVMYHDTRRSNNVSRFFLAEARMRIKLWRSQEADLHPRFKHSMASRGLDAALRHFNAVGEDIAPLVELYRELHGAGLPPKQIVKSMLCKSAAFRWYRYRGRVRNSSQDQLGEYPPGYGIRWF